ncbi:MAG: ATP-binding protein, partial [Pseudomonadota bacterium]
SDLQKLETARTALARKNQLAALGQMSASITHELGQPISAMRNYLAAEEIAQNATPGSVLPELSGLVARMQGIVNQLRQFGQKTQNPGIPFVIQDTITAAQQMVRHTAEAANVRLTVDMPKETVTLTGQPQRFEQVIVNLLRNGIDAVSEQPERLIALALTQDANDVKLTVSDTGPGLGDLDIADLREPFFSTKPSGKGMGLGLAISGQIVNEMGGTLFAQNGPTGGAVFTVTLAKDPHV